MTEERNPSGTNIAATPAAALPVPSHGRSSFFRRDSPSFVLLRLLLYLIFAEAFGFGLGVIFQWVAPRTLPLSGLGLFMQEIARFAATAGAALIMAKAERRPFSAYGLPVRSAFGKLFWQGALLGILEICIVMGVIAAFGDYHFGPLAVHGAAFVRWGFFWALFFVAVGFSEEFSYRGYVQFTLAKGIGFWPAAIFLSALFGAVHLENPGENWAGALGVFVTGLFWCFTLRRTGSLWFAVGMHASFDFGETFLFSVPNSGVSFEGHLSNATLHGATWLTGGTVGPEGSVFDFLILGLFFYLFHRWYPTKPKLPQE